ncbi:hypothetical protein Vretimale_13191 [Volvox reticuliferus]|uniref:Pherophorin domain-containing protein n=1 Tax=Volvox reticuliferus TaxID=1737510 RepID=A0A8J4FTU3_9CHLO|nr:hypothetical protein Vretifemale_14206 [Volvox reticuliferus]GIM09364.1 hypothetical protein Vretimale_13191 [Volvox reticuliferus]
MGRRILLRATSALLLLVGIATGAAQLDTADDIGLGSFGLRRLSAYYARNFGQQIPVACYQSSYFSPFRYYFRSLNLSRSDISTYVFQIDVSTCLVPKAECCRLWLDHVLVRTGSNATVRGIRLNGQAKEFDVGPEGVTIYNMSVEPTVQRSLTLELETPAQGYNYEADLCPQGRFPGSCDIISYDASETCCTERSALPYDMVFPKPPPPPVNMTETGTSPRPAATPPAPPPPSPPPPTPPPPPDGWDLCCIDDVPNSPYILTYQGSKQTGSDTAYLFQIGIRQVVASDYDVDGPQLGDCSQMNLRDVGVAIYGDLIVKSVLFNGSVVDYTLTPQAVTRNSSWLYIGIYRSLDTFKLNVLLDLIITVRGQVPSLCPANDILQSSTACEWTMHGKDGLTHCCPHGITRRAGPFDDCCIDDQGKAPYRLDYLGADVSLDRTEQYFGISVVPVTDDVADNMDEASCDHMTLDSAQIAIYKGVEVLQVKWEDRVMDFNITPATGLSKWLYVNSINAFINDFSPSLSLRLTIILGGAVRELCPAGWLFGADDTTVCEYALHGSQSNNTCCPHGTTIAKPVAKDCSDVPGSPYRLNYQPVAVGDAQTIFNFDLEKVNSTADVALKDIGAEVDCTDMSIRTIALVVRAAVEVQNVLFNGYNYTWQLEPYTNDTNRLNILDIRYSSSDVSFNKPIPLQVLVKGNTTQELCPAASQFSSQSSCKYVIYGVAGVSQCCPSGVTSWTAPHG